MDVGQRGQLEHQGLGCAGHARQRGGNDESDQLELVDIVAKRDGARLVLADRFQDLSERGMDGAMNDKEADTEHGEHQ